MSRAPKAPSTSPVARRTSPSWLTASLESAAAAAATSPIVMQQTAAAAIRSNPIAILRNDAAPDDDSSQSSTVTEEERDLSQLGNDMDALHMSSPHQITVGSLPTRQQRSGWNARKQALSQSANHGGNLLAQSMPVPRAPYLGSRHEPNNEEIDTGMTRTPMPPMELTEPAVLPLEEEENGDHPYDHNHSQSFTDRRNNNTFLSSSYKPQLPSSSIPSAYGSLRESHLQGRFIDGPASYRDARNGRIHNLNRRRIVRFDDSATSYQPDSDSHLKKMAVDPASIASWSQPIAITKTPGARMEAQRRQRLENNTNTNAVEETVSASSPISSSGGASNISNGSISPSSGNNTSKEGSGGGGGGMLSAMLEGQTPPPVASIPTMADFGDCSGHSSIGDLPGEIAPGEMDLFTHNNNSGTADNTNAGMLSTSLTGLEILSASRASGQILQQQQQQQQQPQTAYSLSHASTLVNGIGFSMAEQPFAAEVAGNHSSSSLLSNEVMPPHHGSLGDNPDTEGAFDLEL